MSVQTWKLLCVVATVYAHSFGCCCCFCVLWFSGFFLLRFYHSSELFPSILNSYKYQFKERKLLWTPTFSSAKNNFCLKPNVPLYWVLVTILSCIIVNCIKILNYFLLVDKYLQKALNKWFFWSLTKCFAINFYFFRL